MNKVKVLHEGDVIDAEEMEFVTLSPPRGTYKMHDGTIIELGTDVKTIYRLIGKKMLDGSQAHLLLGKTFVKDISPARIAIIDQIDAICADQDNFEEGEQPPAKKAIDDLKSVIAEGAALSSREIPKGDVATYYGEISITWRHANKILWLTAFSTPGRSPRLDFGTSSETNLGHYQAMVCVDGAKLADKLTWLYTNEAA